MTGGGTTFVAPTPTSFEEPVLKPKYISRKSPNRWNTNERLREKDIIRYAKQEGFLKILSIEELMSRSRDLQDETVRNVENVKIINLSSWKLPNLGPLSTCANLVVCNLGNNFIKSFDSLKCCTRLRKLDLHSNQISSLPNASFWSALQCLTVLYLHDNGISEYQSLKDLSKSPKLTILTMYDTPISLRRYYRHCIVNALWSLKVLDSVVISDEEIIENAKFTMRFSALQAQFKIKLDSLHDEKNLSLSEELIAITNDCERINQLQSRYCPVLVMQRMVRGHLARMHYRYAQDQWTWAAVSIQRFYRQCKGIPGPPPSSVMTTYNKDEDIQSISSLKLDYDTYIKMRRSKEKSVFSFTTNNTIPSESSVGFLRSDKSLINRRPLSKSASKLTSRGTPAGITIDLSLLDATMRDAISKSGKHRRLRALPLNDHVVRDSNKTGTPVQVLRTSSTKAKQSEIPKIPQREENTLPKKDKCKVGKYYTQYKFLGEVLDPGDNDSSNKAEDVVTEDDEKGNINFRLVAQKPPCLEHEPIEEIILRTAQGADDLRYSIRVMENYVASIPTKVPTKTPGTTSAQRMFLRTHGTMSLSCFNAVERAYKDRERAEKWRMKRKFVRDINIRDKKISDRVRHFKEHYGNKAATKSKKERVVLETKIAQNNEETLKDLQERVKQVKIRSLQGKSKGKDGRFVSDFNAQMGSIRAAVISHERSTKRDDILRQKNAIVEGLRDQAETQKSTIKRYFEQRRDVRRAETALEKANIDAMLACQKDRYVYEARDRVRRLKEEDSQCTMTSFIPHQTSAPPRPPILGVISDMQITDWEQQMPKYLQEREHDRSIPP